MPKTMRCYIKDLYIKMGIPVLHETKLKSLEEKRKDALEVA
jgi:hypothetical protein